MANSSLAEVWQPNSVTALSFSRRAIDGCVARQPRHMKRRVSGRNRGLATAAVPSTTPCGRTVGAEHAATLHKALLTDLRSIQSALIRCCAEIERLHPSGNESKASRGETIQDVCTLDRFAKRLIRGMGIDLGRRDACDGLELRVVGSNRPDRKSRRRAENSATASHCRHNMQPVRARRQPKSLRIAYSAQ